MHQSRWRKGLLNVNVYLKAGLFTLVVPGTAAVLIPLVLAGGRPAGGGAQFVLALGLLAPGMALYLRCVWDFAAWGRGTPAFVDAPKRLVARGPYRYTRNPMYVAMLATVLGWAVLFGAAWLVVYALLLLAFFWSFVQFYEEPRLAREFGAEYLAYQRRVNRWLPWPPRSKANGRTPPSGTD